MGWERSFIPLIGNIFDAMPDFPKSREIPRKDNLVWTMPDPPEGNLKKQDSPNHRAMAYNAELARAAAWGSTAEYDKARAIVLAELDLHLNRIGLWTREQFTGTPHGGMYLDAAFAGRAAARKKQDAELLEVLDEYVRRIFTYMAATATPGGEILCCGERMPKDPIAVQQSAVYRELHGLPHPHKAKIEKQLKDDLWVPLRGFRALRASGDTFGGAQEITSGNVTELPFTKHPVEVRRWPGGHLARYVSRPDAGKSGVTDWVLVDHAQADQVKQNPLAGVTFSVGFEKPAPVDRVPAGAQKIERV